MKYEQLWNRIPIFIHFGRIYRSQQHSEEKCHDGKVKKREKIPQKRNCVTPLNCVTVPIALGIPTINCILWKAKSHKKQMKSTGWSDTPPFGRSAQKSKCPDFKYAPGISPSLRRRLPKTQQSKTERQSNTFTRIVYVCRRSISNRIIGCVSK